MGDSSEGNFSYFAEIAASYDRVQSVLSPPYERGLEMIVELIPFEPDDPFEFVDLGCGTAEPTARVLERFGKATGTCLDSEPEMLRIAKRKLVPYSGRYEVREADITDCAIPRCDLVFSAKTFHHVHPDRLPPLLTTDRRARCGPAVVSSCTIRCLSGLAWSAAVRQQASRFRERHVQRAIDSGRVTREEIDARREYKRMMKAAGKDVEYEHRAEDLIDAMTVTGFGEVAVAWRLFADTILLAFVPAGDS